MRGCGSLSLNKVSAEEKGFTRKFKFLRLEVLVPILLLGCSIIMGIMVPSLVTTSIMNRNVPFPPHAILWVGFAVIAFAAVCWIWDEFRNVPHHSNVQNSEERIIWSRIWITFGILLAGYFSVKYVGLVIAGALVHGVLLRFLGGKKLIYIVVTSILYSAAVYLIFEVLFNIRLPRSEIFPYLPF
jgi:hypothetical protein